MTPLDTKTRHQLSGGVWGGAPAENGFSVISYPQIASYDSILYFTCVLKSGVTVPLSLKSGGTGTPVNYAYAAALVFRAPIFMKD